MVLAVPFLIALTTAVPAATAKGVAQSKAVATSPKPGTKDAPVDEYFGPQKMSAIGIRMRIGALARQYDQRTIGDGDLIHDAELVDQSLHDWATKYPRDQWIAPTTLHIAQLYMNVQTPQARSLATSAFKYVTTAAPNTKEAKAAAARLHAGFPALHGETPVVASPTPAPLQTAAPAAGASPPPAAAPSAAAPSAAPSAAPVTSGTPAAQTPAAATPQPTLRGVLERPKSN